MSSTKKPLYPYDRGTNYGSRRNDGGSSGFESGLERRAWIELADGTRLAIGAVADGECLVREGGAIGGGVNFGAGVQGDILYRNATEWTRLPAGTAGQLLQTGGAGGNPSWVSGWTTVKKTANEARTSTTVLTADALLVAQLVASTTYRVRFRVMFLAANATMDAKFDLPFSGTFSAVYHNVMTMPAGSPPGTANVQTATYAAPLPVTVALGPNSGAGVFEVDTIITTTTGGNLSLRWAQNTSDPASLTVLKGSYVEYLAF